MNADLFQNFDQETFLAKRLKDHGMGIFTGVTDPAIRKDRFRQAITAGGLRSVIVGKNTSGKAETYEDLFARIYNEPFEPKKAKGAKP